MRSSSRLSVAIGWALFALITSALPGAANALKAPPSQLRNLEDADRKALEAIAGHSEALRDAVLKASTHVDALVETQRTQEQSSAQFQDRIGKLDRKEQEQIWNVVREPGLLDELATEEAPSRDQLDEIAARHPAELAPAIRAVGAERHDLLVDVAQIHRRANDRFEASISDLDGETQEAFRDLVHEPELLSVLVKRVNLVVRLGDSYRKNPNDTRSYLTALSADVAKRNTAAEKEWKERLESDPKAAQELEQASRDYSEENGYDYDELTDPSVRTRVQIQVYPYPYWFGYPYWYSDAYLYPYGWWYPYPPYFGYYWHHHSVVWWGFPSFGFVDWFFVGHHHHHFAHLSHCFSDHFHSSTVAHTSFNATASNIIARSDPVGGHRGDWSWGRGDGRAGRAAATSLSGRSRDNFFDRGAARQALAPGRRGSTGERGVAVDSMSGRANGLQSRSNSRGRGQTERNAGLVPGDARTLGGRGAGGDSRGHGHSAGSRGAASAPVFESPPADQGRDGRGGSMRGGDGSRGHAANAPFESGSRSRGAPGRGTSDQGGVIINHNNGGGSAGDGGRSGGNSMAAGGDRGGSRGQGGGWSGGGSAGRSGGSSGGWSGGGGGRSGGGWSGGGGRGGGGHGGGGWGGGGGGGHGGGGGWGGGGGGGRGR